jgi:hypothetical protein
MKTTEIPVIITLPPSKIPRSEGLHVSAIIRCVATETGILSPQVAEEVTLVDVREITDPVALLRISIGLAWEQYFIPEILGPLMGVVDHPGEMILDGVYMTHDGESVDLFISETGNSLYEEIIHETKATYKSTRTVGDLATQWMWMAQVKSYCLAKKTNKAMLHVLFLCGDYSYPITPQLKCWLIEFSEDELTDNWSLLMAYKEEKMKEIDAASH